MKTLLTVCFLFATSIGYSQDKKDDANSIQATLESLTAKAGDAEAEVQRLRELYSATHPSLKLAESQLAKIAEAKSKLAAQYAISKLKNTNGQLQEHVKILSEQSAEIKKLMSDETGKQLQNEYKKLHSNMEAVISSLQVQIDKGMASAQNDLMDAMQRFDPRGRYEKYKEALSKSLDNALKDEKSMLEVEKRRIEVLRNKMEERMDALRAQQMALMDQEQAIAKNPELLNAAKAQRSQMAAAFESVLKSKALAEQAQAQMEVQLNAAKKAKAIADKQKQFMAESAYKDSIKKADKQNKEGVDKALKKFDAIQKSLDQKTASVDERLKGVETDLAEVKSLLKKLLEKSK